MKKILFFLFIINAFTAIAQKNDSILSGVYYWNKLEPIKEDTRVRRQVLEGKTFALEYFEIHASTLEPGKAPHPPHTHACLLYTSPSPRDRQKSRMPSSA